MRSVLDVEFKQSRNNLVEAWWILYQGRYVGLIVKSMGIFYVCRCFTERTEVVEEFSNLTDAKAFVLSGGQSA